MTLPYVNAVVLVGRLAGEPVRRPLTAGGEIVSWRLIIDRPRDEGARRVVDALPCASFERDVHELTLDWQPGDLIEAHGSLRRRFWSQDQSSMSRFEVEVYQACSVAPEAAVPAHPPSPPPPPGDAPASRPPHPHPR